jgi:ferric-dicitrate binding protein FerR (iron transport regulator)
LEQARRRAARWHAWLKSPECTFQDRENFERWCADVTNAAAYVEFCGDLAAVTELAGDGDGYSEQVLTSFGRSPRLEADQR